MCSRELLLWKNQKGSTCYPTTLYKRNSTTDIFLRNNQLSFGQAISQNSSKPLIVKGFYLLRMSNDCCFYRAEQGQLSQCNRRNTATVLRAVVKSHQGLKETKAFSCILKQTSKILSKFAGKRPCWSPFIVKLRPVVACKNAKVNKDNWVNFNKKETHTQKLLHKYFL